MVIIIQNKFYTPSNEYKSAKISEIKEYNLLYSSLIILLDHIMYFIIFVCVTQSHMLSIIS